MNKKVVFFDLGAYQGDSIDRFIEVSESMNLDYQIFSFEPHPHNYGQCIKKYGDNDRVTIFPIAIAGNEGHLKLFEGKGTVGYSIYGSKRNVSKATYNVVPCWRFSYFYNTFKDMFKDSTLVLKANMEGAELNLVRDLDANDLFKEFSYYCSFRTSLTTDIKKCNKIKKYAGEVEEILSKNNINVIRERHLHAKLKEVIDE